MLRKWQKPGVGKTVDFRSGVVTKRWGLELRMCTPTFVKWGKITLSAFQTTNLISKDSRRVH